MPMGNPKVSAKRSRNLACWEGVSHGRLAVSQSALSLVVFLNLEVILSVGLRAEPDSLKGPIIDHYREIISSQGVSHQTSPADAQIPPKLPVYATEELDTAGLGIEPNEGSDDWKRLLGVHAYDGDRWIYQDFRHETLWDLEPRVGYEWKYDSNILQTQNDRIADWYQTVGTGLHFRLGRMTGSPEELKTVFAVETDYQVSHDWFVSNPNQNALNNQGQIDVRIGRDKLIFHPYLVVNHITGTYPLEPQLSGRYTSTNLTAGLKIDQELDPLITHHMDYNWGQIDQQSNKNVGYSLWSLNHELIFKLITNDGHGQDLRFLTENNVFGWGTVQNASANNRSASVDYLMGGIGTRGTLSGQWSYSCKLGWQNIQRGWDTLVGKDLSTFYLDSSLRYDLNRHFFIELFWLRGYQLAQSDDDNNYIDNSFTIDPVIRIEPGWELKPDFSIGTTNSEQNDQTMYYTPSLELDYVFPNRLKSRIKMKIEYDESRALHGTGGDVIGWRSTFGVDLRF